MPNTDKVGGFVISKEDRQDLSVYFDSEVLGDISARGAWEEKRATARRLLYPEKEVSKLGPEYSNVKLPAIGDVLRLRPRYRDAILGDGRDIVHLNPVGPEDSKKAILRTKYTNWELVNEAKVFRLVNNWIFDALVDGTGWIKNRQVTKVGRVLDKEGKVRQKVLFNGAQPLSVPGTDIIVPRSATHNDTVQSLERIGHILRWNIFQAKNAKARFQQEGRGFIDKEAFDRFLRMFDVEGSVLSQKIPKEQINGGVTSRVHNAEVVEEQRTSGVWSSDEYRRDIVEIYFTFDATPGRKSDPQEYVGWWSPDTGELLAAREIFGYNPRPLHKMTGFPTDSFYGVGLPLVLEVWLEIYSALFNASVNYALLSNLPFGVSATARGKRKKLRLVPGEVTTGIPADTTFPNLQRLDGSFFKILETVKGIKGELGSSDLFAGNSRSSAGANAPATTVIGLIEQASVTMGDIGKTMMEEFVGFVAARVDMNRRLLSSEKQFRVLNNNEVVFEKISPDDFPEVDPDVVINRDVSAAFKSLKQQTANIMYSNLKENPLIAPSQLNNGDTSRLQALTRAYMKAFDFDHPEILDDVQEETNGQQGPGTPTGPPQPAQAGVGGLPQGATIPSLATAFAGASGNNGNQGRNGNQ